MIQLFRPKYEVEQCLKNIREVLEYGWTGYGPKSAEFEKEFGKFIGSEHCLFVNSATAGLHLAVKMLDLPPGSKIVSTPLTFVSTNHVILYEGHIPVFADIGEDLSLDVESVKKAVKEHDAKAVIWVHYSGSVNEHFSGFCIWAKNNGVKVIEDCAHACGSFYPYTLVEADDENIKTKHLRVGSGQSMCPPDFSVFSFQAVKNLPTCDSGMLVVRTSEQLERAKKLSWLGIDKSTYARTSTSGNELYKWKYSVDELGWKYNGNDVVAAIALAQLKVVDRDNAYRKQVYSWYEENLSGSAVDLVRQNKYSSHHLIEVVVRYRDRIMSELKMNGYAPGVHYLPNYEFSVFNKFYKEGDCPNCESIAENIMTLPCHLELTREDVDKISEIVIRMNGG